MSYNVQIAGNGLNVVTPKKTTETIEGRYDIKIDLVPVTNSTSGIDFNKGGGIESNFIDEKFNILLVTNPEYPGSRRVETIKAKVLFPLMGNADPTFSYYATTETGTGGIGASVNYNGFNVNDYNNLPKINEGNIPYLHGQLIKFGKVPFESLPTDGTVEDQNTILSQRGALNTLGMLGRAITVDSNGNLVLLGYQKSETQNGNAKMIAMSKASIKEDVETPMETLFEEWYPRI